MHKWLIVNSIWQESVASNRGGIVAFTVEQRFLDESRPQTVVMRNRGTLSLPSGVFVCLRPPVVCLSGAITLSVTSENARTRDK